MKKIVSSIILGLGLSVGLSLSASAGCKCCITKTCDKGGYVYLKRYKKVAVTCYKKAAYRVKASCVSTTTCEPMTCYHTKTKMVKSTCYKVEPYMKRVWQDADRIIK